MNTHMAKTAKPYYFKWFRVIRMVSVKFFRPPTKFAFIWLRNFPRPNGVSNIISGSLLYRSSMFSRKSNPFFSVKNVIFLAKSISLSSIFFIFSIFLFFVFSRGFIYSVSVFLFPFSGIRYGLIPIFSIILFSFFFSFLFIFVRHIKYYNTNNHGWKPTGKK